MRKSIAILSCLLAAMMMVGLLGGCGKSDGQKTITILSANYEELVPEQLDFLNSKFPDTEFVITCLSSGNLAAKVQAEGSQTEADILYSLSSSYANTLKEEGLLRAYTPGSTYLPEYADPENICIPNGVWCGAILVNTEAITQLGLPEPKSYMDLLDPQYKGHIVMSNPETSSTGYFFLLGLINLYGEAEGWKYFEDLKSNIMQYSESGSGPASMVEMGECAIGLGIDYQGIKLQTDGKPVKVIFAQEGAPYDNDTILLVDKGSEPDAIVLEVLKVMTSAEGNAVFNDYSKAVIQGAADNEAYPADFKVLDMNGITDSAVKEQLLETWGKRIG